jgi:hypothetical protein
LKKRPLWVCGANTIGAGFGSGVLTLTSNHRPESVVSTTASLLMAIRSTAPSDAPLWLTSGVTPRGRNVFIVAPLMRRGNTIKPPPRVCRADTTVSTRVKESKLLSSISGSSGRLLTGVVT